MQFLILLLHHHGYYWFLCPHGTNTLTKVYIYIFTEYRKAYSDKLSKTNVY